MNTTRIKINEKIFIVDDCFEKQIIDYVKKLADVRLKYLEVKFEDLRKKILDFNPKIDETKLIHEINYILSKSGYKHSDIANFLKIDRSTSYKNCERVENELWIENRSSISEKTMTKRIEAMKDYVSN